MKELIDKTIRKISIDGERQEYLAFETDQGPVIYRADGDCCSESWFADILGFHALVGHTVREVEEVDLPWDEGDGRCRQDSDNVYGFKFTTTGGHADIIFRNSSNGYYGGDLEVVSNLPADMKMVELDDDYGA